jgi:site-specific DNA-methyltransferase (adenine-specific)
MKIPCLFNRVFNSDCVEGMKLLSPQSIDLVITDPPFGIEFKAKRENYNRKDSRVLEGYNEIHEDNYLTFTENWMVQVKQLLKPSGSAFIFSGWNNLKDILITLDKLGFITVNHLIWKYQFGVVTSRKFVTSHYHCLFVLTIKNASFFHFLVLIKMKKIRTEVHFHILIEKMFG